MTPTRSKKTKGYCHSDENRNQEVEPNFYPMKFKILIVDDNKLNLKMIEDFIFSLDHSPLLACNGAKAFEEVKKQQVDLILLDIEMPVMNGIELLRQLKRDKSYSQIPVIMLTALDDVKSAVESIKLGAEDYLTKPLNFTLLENRIKGVLEKRKAIVKAQRLGQYTIEGIIGEGGMSQVYKANHIMMCRPAAVKVLKPERTDQNSFTLFEREVKITSLLSHPNTIVVYDYGSSSDGSFYYVMEYLPGVNLKELVETWGTLNEERVIHIITQACGSLGEAHQKGLLHRDVKPANIMLCERGGIYDFVKVLDFGIGVFRDEPEKNLSDKNRQYIIGTPGFLSPEAIQGSDRMDVSSDIYSLGAVAYYLLTGKRIFEEKSLQKLLLCHIQENPPPLSSICHHLSPDLEIVIMSCLEKEKSKRPQSAEKLRDMLLKCQRAGKWRQSGAEKQWKKIMEESKISPVKEKRSTIIKALNINLEKKFSDPQDIAEEKTAKLIQQNE